MTGNMTGLHVLWYVLCAEFATDKLFSPDVIVRVECLAVLVDTPFISGRICWARCCESFRGSSLGCCRIQLALVLVVAYNIALLAAGGQVTHSPITLSFHVGKMAVTGQDGR